MRGAVLAVLLVLPAGLVACSTTDPAAPAASASAAAVSLPPGQDQYLTALKAISPALVAKPDDAVSTARNVCQELKGGDIVAEVVLDEMARDNLDQAAAVKVVVAAEEWLCPQ
jgi:hypothetical protein